MLFILKGKTMPYAQLENYEPKIILKPPLQILKNTQQDRPSWIPAHITENWDPDPFAYQTEEELMPAGGLHGQLLTYIAEVVRVPLEKQGLMLLIDTFLLYRDAKQVRRRIGPDLLLMENTFPAPSAYDLDIRPPPRCVVETTSPNSHLKDLEDNVPFYFSLGIETYLVIDAITPQKKLREPINLHLWRRTRGKAYKKIKADSVGYFKLPEMNLKITTQQQRLIFADAVTGEVLRDSGQLSEALEEAEKCAKAEAQRADAEAQRADTEAQRADAEAQRAKIAFSEGEQKGRLIIARNLLATGVGPDIIAKTTGLSTKDIATLSVK
jgi:Uma2 family endonuclease